MFGCHLRRQVSSPLADPLIGKKIVLGVCGGIAAYKAVELLREITRSGASVRVIMTRAAQEFVGPVTFETLSGHPVWTKMFDAQPNGSASEGSIRHIEWATEAAATLIAPATANIIAKMAVGLADDPLSTFVLATTAPILVCPSMNANMYKNKMVQTNIARLADAGVAIMEPESGILACGVEGTGRLPQPAFIVERLRCLIAPQDLEGRQILITAGPTQELIDPARFISNPSTGKMGFELAIQARRRGAKVILVSGPTALCDPPGITSIRVRTAQEMLNAVMAHAGPETIVIKTAAVSDWRPPRNFPNKQKKEDMSCTLCLEPTQDIVKTLSDKRPRCAIIVGFAAETHDIELHARQKLERKNLDLVVGNKIGSDTSGFGVDTTEAVIVYRGGRTENLPLLRKQELAALLLNRIVERIAELHKTQSQKNMNQLSPRVQT